MYALDFSLHRLGKQGVIHISCLSPKPSSLNNSISLSFLSCAGINRLSVAGPSRVIHVYKPLLKSDVSGPRSKLVYGGHFS